MLNYDLLASKIGKAVGSSNLHYAPEGVTSYAVDGKAPRIVVFPANPDEISQVLKIANEEEISIIPWSGGTKIALGNIPKSVDVVLCMNRLDEIVEHDGANLTVMAQAGLTLENLQNVLKEKGQFLPLDPPRSSKCSLGGIIATNSNGPRRLLYGSVRDLLIGIKVVTPMGEQIKGGGKVVKNVAGYDMCKLFVGSLGTLGIITEATFKLLPVPEAERTVVVLFNTLSQAFEFAATVFNSPLIPSALEVMNPFALGMIADITGLFSNKNSYSVAVGIEGLKESVERQVSDIKSISKEKYVGLEILEGKEHRRFWRSISDPEELSTLRKKKIIKCKIGVPISKAFDTFKNFEEASAMLEVKPFLISGAGSGVIYAFFSLDRVYDLTQFIKVQLSFVAQLGGYLILESAPTQVKREIDVWGRVPGGSELMRTLKRRFDPKGILNPNRFLVDI